MKKDIQNIVFDVGMVLIDFCWDKHCRNLGFSEEIIHAFEVNMITSEYWGKMDEGTIKTEEAIQEFIKKMPRYRGEIEQFWEQPEHFVEEYDYAAPVIRELKQKGYGVYLLSNYPYDMYQLHWPSFTFYPLVDGYIVSAAEKLKKPDPVIYKRLCERYQLKPEECLFIDDKIENVDAAIGIGMQAVQFTDYCKLKEFLSI